MVEVEIKELLEAGVHLGHKKRKWNPKMQQYIYDDKGGICIINLVKTIDLLQKACDFLREAAANRKNIIFVGTKKHIADVIKEEAIRCGAFFINRRWLGGLLTNYDTIRHRLNRLKEIEEMQEAGTLSRMNKKELSALNKELDKLQKVLGGIKGMKGKPDILFVIDQQEEHIAIKEAKIVGLKIVAMIDTNCDPVGIDYPIPANDDSIRSVKLISKLIANEILKGKESNVYEANKNWTNNGNASNPRKHQEREQLVQPPQEVTAVSEE